MVGQAGNGVETLQLAVNLKPDVIVLDIMMSDINGIELTRLVRKQSPQINVVMLSMYSDEAYVRESIRAGAKGYVLKESPVEELIMAVKQAAAGQHYLCKAIPAHLGEYCLVKGAMNASDSHGILTPREQQVLYLLAKGCTNEEIASRLLISRRTAEGHCASIMHKLGAKNRAEVIHYALKQPDLPKSL